MAESIYFLCSQLHISSEKKDIHPWILEEVPDILVEQDSFHENDIASLLAVPFIFCPCLYVIAYPNVNLAGVSGLFGMILG